MYLVIKLLVELTLSAVLPVTKPGNVDVAFTFGRFDQIKLFEFQSVFHKDNTLLFQ